MVFPHRELNGKGRAGDEKEMLPAFSPSLAFSRISNTKTTSVSSLKLVSFAGYRKESTHKWPSREASCPELLARLLGSKGKMGGVGHSCSAGTNGTASVLH